MTGASVIWRGPWRAFVTDGWGGPEFERLVSQFNRVGHRESDQVLQDNARSLVVKTSLHGLPVVIKKSWDRGVSKRLKRRILPPRASRAWHGARLVTDLGIETPQRVAYVAKRGVLDCDAWLVTRYVAGVSARDYLTRDDVTEGEKRRVVTQIVQTYVQLHAHSVVHGDNRPGNFLIRGHELVLLDLDVTVRVPWWCGLRQRYMQRDWRRLLARWRRQPAIESLFREVIAAHGLPERLTGVAPDARVGEHPYGFRDPYH